MIRKWLRYFQQDECGATIVEYSVMLAMIVLVSFAAMRLMGGEVGAFYDFSASEIDSFFSVETGDLE